MNKLIIYNRHSPQFSSFLKSLTLRNHQQNQHQHHKPPSSLLSNHVPRPHVFCFMLYLFVVFSTARLLCTGIRQSLVIWLLAVNFPLYSSCPQALQSVFRRSCWLPSLKNCIPRLYGLLLYINPIFSTINTNAHCLKTIPYTPAITTLYLINT